MNFITTKDHFTKNKVYTEERQQIHLQIIRDTANDSPNPLDQPEAVLIGGGVASGKSTIYPLVEEERYEKLKATITIANSDNIKEDLPEYFTLKNHVPIVAADVVHEESSDLANKLLDYCIENNLNLIYEGTMKNYEKYYALVRRLKSQGYKVICIIVDVPIEIARKRAQERFEITGRNVPDNIIVDSHTKSVLAFRQLEKEFDEYLIYDNREFPELVAKKTSEGDEVLDLERYLDYMNKCEY